MNYSTKHEYTPRIAPECDRCVWMNAGILSYQLCNREFDCDHCPLDHAIRMHVDGPSIHTGGASPVPPPRLPDSEKYLYSPGHCWVEQREGMTARIGIEPMLGSVLIAPKAIVFPSIGQIIELHDSFCWIVVDGVTLQMRSPIDGEIREINTQLLHAPQELCENSLTAGWLLEVDLGGPLGPSESLMGKTTIQRQYDLDLARFNKLLSEELHNVHLPTITMNDGGTPLRSVPEGMATKRYFEILRSAFRL